MTTQEQIAIGEALAKYPGMRDRLKSHWLKHWNNNPEAHYFGIRDFTTEEFNAFKELGLLQGKDSFYAKLTVKGCQQCAIWAS